MIASKLRALFILIQALSNNYAKSKPARGECSLWLRIEPCGFNIFTNVRTAWFDPAVALRAMADRYNFPIVLSSIFRCISKDHHERSFVNFDLQFLNQISVLILFSTVFLMATPTNEFVQPKKQAKVTAQDCVQEILEGQQIAARQLQYLGQIQSFELQWGQDFMEDEGIFKKAKPQQLQQYRDFKRKSNQARLEYEKVLKDERDFLKQFEQTVLAPQNKKKT